jgi:hypothetical protein
MKTKLLITGLALLALSTLNPQLSTAFAQGSLTPPGAPAPTMKSADQIYSKLDPRTPISTAPYTITNSGSYYLTTNLTVSSLGDGIDINANNVTLDLNGFAIQGMPGSGSGIDFDNPTNITVRNGSISGFGFFGVQGGHGNNVVLERLNVSACGEGGISVIGTAVVRDCNCCSNSVSGISVGSGIVSGCSAQNNSGSGISVWNGTVVTGGTVSGCFLAVNKGAGIYVGGNGSDVIGNTCIGNGTGISIVGSDNRVEDNHVVASGSAGISVPSSSYYDNIIIKNSVYGANNYSGAGFSSNGNVVGPFITTEGTITSVNPWANFSF